MSWTQKEIADWGRETFGVAKDPYSILHKVMEEFTEMLVAADDRAQEEVLKEAADVVITIIQLVDNLGGNLQEQIDKKMDINSKRTWVLTGDGVGRHV